MKTRARSTPYAVLGMLSLSPMSGYDMRKESETSIGFFWSESYGQIYPALRELETRRLIRRRPGARGGGRDRHVYEITESGQKALEAWRAQPPRAAPVRNELLLKLFFGRAGETRHEIGWIEERLERERAVLLEFTRLREGLTKEQSDHPSVPYWLITLSYGEHHARSVIRWCLETRRALKTMARPTPRKGASR